MVADVLAHTDDLEEMMAWRMEGQEYEPSECSDRFPTHPTICRTFRPLSSSRQLWQRLIAASVLPGHSCFGSADLMPDN